MKQKLLKFTLIFAVLFALFVIPHTVNAATSGIYTYSVLNGEASITDCSTYATGSITIPSTIDGYPVTSIEYEAFINCSNITSIIIPKGVEFIGDYAFFGCCELTNIVIPDSVTTIGGFAFGGCKALTSITIPYGVTTIYDSVFEGCSSLTSVTIPDSVTSIGSQAFYGCKNLTSITIPDSITSIKGGAFQDTAYYNNSNNWDNDVLYIGNHLINANTSLTGEYTIRTGTKTISDSAFRDCTKLTSITIPDGVISIGKYAFEYCTGLSIITIPDGVKSIGNSAFYNCTSLTSITIPDSVTRMGDYVVCGTAFFEDGNNWDNGVLYVDNHLIKADYISGNYVVKSGTKTIADYAFYDCQELTGIIIPDSVTYIGYRTFEDCTSLTSITIPGGITSIGDFAFRGCTSLTSITIPDSVTSIGGYAFYGCDNVTISGYPGSYAQTYANENSIEFIPLAQPKPAVTVTARSYVSNNVVVIKATCSKEITDECLHIALFNGNDTLVDYIIVPSDEPFDSMNVVFKDDDNAAYAKVFLWENMISTQPIADAVKVDIER